MKDGQDEPTTVVKQIGQHPRREAPVSPQLRRVKLRGR